MERLTKRITENQIELSAKANPTQYVNSPQRVHIKHPFWNVFERLAYYEDLEEQGKLLELPCKVGDVVYCEEKCNVHKGIQAFQITNILISQNKKGKWTKKYRAMLLLNGKTIDWQLNFDFEELGKTVFLTKEEAEKAFAEMEK